MIFRPSIYIFKSKTVKRVNMVIRKIRKVVLGLFLYEDELSKGSRNHGSVLNFEVLVKRPINHSGRLVRVEIREKKRR